MFYDLNIRGNDYKHNLKLAMEASRFGWNHINFVYSPNSYENALEFKGKLENNLENINIDYTLEIKSSNLNEIRKIARKFRNKTNCISVVGGDLKVNRAVLENIQLDVLSRPYLKRKDAGINHVLAKEAVNNNVAIELSFKDILNSYLSYRSKIIANFKDIYLLYRKFKFPLILSSGAEDIFDIRFVKDFSSFFIATGLNKDEVLDSISKTPESILNYNRNRENLVLKGVRELNNEA